MSILVTGGAGYIGSIISEELVRTGNDVVCLDNLELGHREAIEPGVKFIEADLSDINALDKLFKENEIDVVIHMAGEALVGESMTNPEKYFRVNIAGGLSLISSMVRNNVRKIIFSSSAATYGIPSKTPIEEDFPQLPINPYGESKLIFEKMLRWYSAAYDLRYVALRYFNVAGASLKHGEDHNPETHVIPNILNVAAGQADKMVIFGNDYPTKDGSCVRDYVHVLDLANAHILGIDKLKEISGGKAYNIGSEQGYSLFEAVECARKITGKEIPTIISDRRPGDPPVLTAISRLAKKELGWIPKYQQLDAMIESAWKWKQAHPHGYQGK